MKLSFSGSTLLNKEYKAYENIFYFLLWMGIIATMELLAMVLNYGILGYEEIKNYIFYSSFLEEEHYLWLKLVVSIGLSVCAYYFYRRIEECLDVWEQSLLRRKSDEELKESFFRGERIIYGGIECEVINGQFVPKRGGIVLANSHGSSVILNDKVYESK